MEYICKYVTDYATHGLPSGANVSASDAAQYSTLYPIWRSNVHNHLSSPETVHSYHFEHLRHFFVFTLIYVHTNISTNL